MGSGGIVVLDEDSCMVDTARYFTEFCVDESCGRCTPCRAGLPRMLEVFEKIIHGQGEMGDIGTLEKSSVYIRDASLCGLGQTAPNPVLTTLRYFKNEYVRHIVDRECEAGICFKTRDEDEEQ
jgi:NADH:ubiquinone oxidoreductase subunit F (NADH-binding)